MISYNWKVLEMYGTTEACKEVKYFVVATDGENSVETQGQWTFKEPLKLFPEMLEVDVITYLNNDCVQNDVNIIKLALDNQLQALKQLNISKKPWEKPTFKPNL